MIMNELEKQILEDVVAELKQNDLSNDIEIVPCAEAIDELLELACHSYALQNVQHDLKE